MNIEKLCSKSYVIPAQAGIQQIEAARVADESKMSSRFAGDFLNHLDSGLRRNDESVGLSK